jgi:hypothetical protein
VQRHATVVKVQALPATCKQENHLFFQGESAKLLLTEGMWIIDKLVLNL